MKVYNFYFDEGEEIIEVIVGNKWFLVLFLWFWELRIILRSEN